MIYAQVCSLVQQMVGVTTNSWAALRTCVRETVRHPLCLTVCLCYSSGSNPEKDRRECLPTNATTVHSD
jgi:hypothetical protein